MPPRQTVLVVDDIPANIQMITAALDCEFAIKAATRGERALDLAPTADLILLDIEMPGMDGFDVCRRLKGDPGTADIPVLFLTARTEVAAETLGFSLGGSDFIHKPFSPSVVQARVRAHLSLAEAKRDLRQRNLALEKIVEQHTLEIRRQAADLVRHKQDVIAVQSSTIDAFCRMIEARDNETGSHINRTQDFVKTLAERLRDHPRFQDQLDDVRISLLHKAAPLHDIGKLAIPDAILWKPAHLDEAEWRIMRTHCVHGYDAIQKGGPEDGEAALFLRYAREITLSHHERWNGAGYPHGLAGEAIPLSARLMAVADVYDALTSPRVYKPAYTHEHAIEIMLAERRQHFDPDILDALISDADTFRAISQRYCDAPPLGD